MAMGGNPGHDAKHAEIEASTPAPLKSTRAAAPLLTSALRLHQRETHRVPLRHPPSSPRYTLQDRHSAISSGCHFCSPLAISSRKTPRLSLPSKPALSHRSK